MKRNSNNTELKKKKKRNIADSIESRTRGFLVNGDNNKVGRVSGCEVVKMKVAYHSFMSALQIRSKWMLYEKTGLLFHQNNPVVSSFMAAQRSWKFSFLLGECLGIRS